MTPSTRRFIGGRAVSAIGLGAAQWTFVGGSPSDPPADELGIRSIHTALDAGINFIATARVYTTADDPGHSETLVAKALATHAAGSQVMVATHGGHHRSGDRFVVDLRPDTIRRHAETSLRLLGVDCLDLYILHYPTWQDAANYLGDYAAPPVHADVPLATVMVAFSELQSEGLIRNVGLSNVSLSQLAEAQSVLQIAAVENRFGPFKQDDNLVLDYCTEHSIAYLAYSPLRGPGIQPARDKQFAETFPKSAVVARRKNISNHCLALAWLLHRWPAMIPLSGASRPETIGDSARAIAVTLTDDELRELDF